MKIYERLDLLEEAKQVAPLTPVIIITAFGTIESAIQAMKKGLREKYSLDQFEKEYRRVLIEVGGNKSRAAEILSHDRKTLYRKLEEI
jgi:DNA-binding NtrC family response regulator